MHDVRAREVHDRIAVRVRGWGVRDGDGLSVQVQRHRVVEGDHGKGRGRCWHHLSIECAQELADAHALSHAVVCDDHAAGLSEVLVAAGVISVQVRVDHEANGSLA